MIQLEVSEAVKASLNVFLDIFQPAKSVWI